MAKNISDFCIADASFVSYFVFCGYAPLLKRITRNPVLLTPGILDPFEPSGTEFLKSEPRSELLRPLFHDQASERAKEAHLHSRSFLQAPGELWQPVELSPGEMENAARMMRTEVWGSGSQKRMRGLDAAEAETLAVAIERKWTFLADDQAAVTLASSIAPKLRIINKSEMLLAAVEEEILQCTEADRIFNEQFCQKWGFYTKGATGKGLSRFCTNPCRAHEQQRPTDSAEYFSH